MGTKEEGREASEGPQRGLVGLETGGNLATVVTRTTQIKKLSRSWYTP